MCTKIVDEIDTRKIIITFTFVPEGTYLFVTAGWNNQKQIADTELVDLSDSLNHCKTLPEYLKRVQVSI